MTDISEHQHPDAIEYTPQPFRMPNLALCREPNIVDDIGEPKEMEYGRYNCETNEMEYMQANGEWLPWSKLKPLLQLQTDGVIAERMRLRDQEIEADRKCIAELGKMKFAARRKIDAKAKPEWYMLSAFTLMAKRDGWKLLISLNPDGDGGFGVIALQTPGSKVDEVLDEHSHQNLGIHSFPKAMVVAQEYADRWVPGGETPCECDDIDKTKKKSPRNRRALKRKSKKR